MKNLSIIACLSPVFVLIFLGCKKEQGDMESVSIIGIDPCTAGYTENSGKGNVLRLGKTSDTVVTYNLPPSVENQIDPDAMKTDGKYSFADEKILKVNLSYKFATDEEEVWPLCLANLPAPWGIKKQIIILHHSNM